MFVSRLPRDTRSVEEQRDVDLAKQLSGTCFNEHKVTFTKFNKSVFLEYLAHICSVTLAPPIRPFNQSDQLLENLSHDLLRLDQGDRDPTALDNQGS